MYEECDDYDGSDDNNDNNKHNIISCLFYLVGELATAAIDSDDVRPVLILNRKFTLFECWGDKLILVEFKEVMLMMLLLFFVLLLMKMSLML